MTFWGATVGPSEAYTMMPTSPLHVTKAVLGTQETTGSARNVVQCRVGDGEPVCVCSLRGNVEEQTSLDLVFEQGAKITFIASGPGTVHLTGYYVKHFVEEPDDDDDEDYVDDGEDDDEDDDEEKEDEEDEEEDEDEEEEKEDEKAQAGKKRSREEKTEEKVETAAPETKKQCATPQRDTGAARKSVHFTDKAEPSTPQNTTQRKSHLQTPYNKSRQVPDTILPSPTSSKEAKPQAQQKENKKDKNKNKEEGKAEAEKEHRTPEGLRYKEVRVGKGAVAKPGCRASVRYVGMLTNGKVFDRSRAPFTFKLGAREVIRGWDIGVSGMRVGGKRQLIIPSHLGYGASGAGPIPPNATLVFDVELVSIR